jgi:hypothetical protein
VPGENQLPLNYNAAILTQLLYCRLEMDSVTTSLALPAIFYPKNKHANLFAMCPIMTANYKTKKTASNELSFTPMNN